jgi:protein phosphatase
MRTTEPSTPSSETSNACPRLLEPVPYATPTLGSPERTIGPAPGRDAFGEGEQEDRRERESVVRPRASKIEQLRHVPLFAGLSRREIVSILRMSDDVEFFPGETIVKHGLHANDFYLLLEGQARVTVPGKRSRILRTGDYFGEISVLDGGPRTADVEALTHVTLLRIGRQAFVRLLDDIGPVARKILVVMCQRVRAAERHHREQY